VSKVHDAEEADGSQLKTMSSEICDIKPNRCRYYALDETLARGSKSSSSIHRREIHASSLREWGWLHVGASYRIVTETYRIVTRIESPDPVYLAIYCFNVHLTTLFFFPTHYLSHLYLSVLLILLILSFV
jgi:hypothetical protein